MGEKLYLQSASQLRGIACIVVVFFHYIDPLNLNRFALYDFFQIFKTPLVQQGYIWLDVFFFLSGAILFFRYHEDLKLELKSYYISRASRLLPLYFIGFFVFFVLFELSLIIDFSDSKLRYSHENFFHHIFLTAYWGLEKIPKWNYPLWSLSVEWFLTLIFPLIRFFIIKSPEILRRISLLVILIAYFLFLLPYEFVTNEVPKTHALLRGLFPFLLGALSMSMHEAYVKKISSEIGWLLLFLALIFINSTVPLFIGLILLFTAITLIMHSEIQEKKIAKSSFLSTLGTLSFSLYVWHIPVYEFLSLIHI